MKKEPFCTLELDYLDFLLLYHSLKLCKVSNVFFTDEQKQALVKYMERI